MASSQVQISSLAPFGCVAREGYGESDKAAMKKQDAFHSKLKSLVRDHLPAITSDAAKDPQRKTDRIYPCFAKDPLTPTHARIVDRWATQQAREMVSTIERHTQAANTLCRPDPNTTTAGERSPSQSSDNSTKGASSLVQMWEARLCQPNGSSNNNTNSPRCIIRCSSSALSCPENEHLANEDPTSDWDSDGTAATKDPSPTPKARGSSASDTERGRVANIIRRLISKGDNIDNDPSPAVDSPFREREGAASPHFHGQKPFLQATSSPRIRGRQAFSDLLMQLERDRHKELDNLSDRQVVSRFSQKGRIQANLKLKILQRGLASHDQHPLTLFRGPGTVPGASNSPRIQQLREESNNEIADLEAPMPSVVSSESQTGNASMDDCTMDGSRTSDTMTKEGDGNSRDATTSDTAVDIIGYDDRNMDRVQSLDVCSSSNSRFEDEQDYDEDMQTESKYGWISRISRPRSYWEDRRQSWYQEMLEQDSTKDDIRQLLQSRRVSNFLSSDFLGMMNDLMLRKQTNILDQPDDDHFDLDFRISSQISQSYERLTRQLEEVVGDQDESQVEGNECEVVATQVMLDEEAEEEIMEVGVEGSDDQYRDASDHSHLSHLSSQSSAESPARSWGFDDRNNPASPARSLQSQAYYMDPSQHTRSMEHLSMEIELINELRGQMKQLQREMSKLKRSLKTCMDMQAPMQYYMKQEISPPGDVPELSSRSRGPF